MEFTPKALIDMPGSMELFIAMESWDHPEDEMVGPATESAIGAFTSKSVLATIEQLSSQFTRWYADSCRCVDQLVKKVHSTNAARVEVLAEEMKMLSRNEKALKKKVRERNLPQQERDAAQVELDQVQDAILRNRAIYRAFVDNIYIPHKVNEIYMTGIHAYSIYQAMIDNEIAAYVEFDKNTIEKDKLDDIRDFAQKKYESIVSRERDGESASKTIQHAVKMIGQIPAGGDTLVNYPVEHFIEAGNLLRKTKNQLVPLFNTLSVVRNNLRRRTYGDSGDRWENETSMLRVRMVGLIFQDASQYWKDRFSLEMTTIGRANFPVLNGSTSKIQSK